jgi:hypothetical protein
VFCGNNPVNRSDPSGLDDDFYRRYEREFDRVAFDPWNLCVASLFGRESFLSRITIDITQGRQGEGQAGNIAAGAAFMRHYGVHGATAAFGAELMNADADSFEDRVQDALGSFRDNARGAIREIRERPLRAYCTVLSAPHGNSGVMSRNDT